MILRVRVGRIEEEDFLVLGEKDRRLMGMMYMMGIARGDLRAWERKSCCRRRRKSWHGSGCFGTRMIEGGLSFSLRNTSSRIAYLCLVYAYIHSSSTNPNFLKSY